MTDLDELVDNALRDLHNKSGPETKFYGEFTGLSETQERLLGILTYLLPGHFVRALNDIEGKLCQLYKQKDRGRSVWIIDDCFVFTNAWTCSCRDFCTALYTSPVGGSRWKRSCHHLIAAYLLEQNYAFLKHPKAARELGLDDFVDLFRIYRAPAMFR